nr:phage polarity suppression protein [Buttiauxella brennerae]
MRSQEVVQHISIGNALGAFMTQNGAVLVCTLAPELMGINKLPASVSELAIRRATHYLGEALRDYLVTGPEIHYTAENSDILTAIGFRPEKASRADNQQKYTPAQNHVYAHQQQPPANNRPEIPAI